ncbi:small GTPase superfamily [Gilbertella persicaria]|uniref:small GTPase superfamily n=1 Tax=Gilbertella persicaria TaxID=101096 RepID=UPI00221E5775|nr:small GTPase superfamily [Gilbertella persicaria]KAI8091395.1 small GTPase superfamily [Gilbertella persicaria]
MLCTGTKKSMKRKVVVVGDGACGKTSLLNVYTSGYFPQTYEPTVFENYVQHVNVDERHVELSIWDTAVIHDRVKLGQEEFDRIRALSYSDTHVIVICYSVDNRDSLENIPNRWLEELQEGCPFAKIILVALKCDLRQDETALKTMKLIGYEERIIKGLEVAKKIHAIRYLECSAKHNRGVRECFEQAARVATFVKLDNEAESKPCVIL